MTVIDPIAEADAFPGAERVLASADIPGLDPDATPYVVVATQGIWDEEAVASALTRDAAYVGLVASPTRANVVREWLREETTVADERLAALRAPAGLDLGAETAEEIAALDPGRAGPGPPRPCRLRGGTRSGDGRRRRCPRRSPSSRSSTTSSSSTRSAA